MQLVWLLRHARLCFLTIILLTAPSGAEADDRWDIEQAVEEADNMITLMPAHTKNWFLYAIPLQDIRDCRVLEALETYLQQCLMKRECGKGRQQEISRNYYDNKQACS
jgi:hypothetical protein